MFETMVIQKKINTQQQLHFSFQQWNTYGNVFLLIKKEKVVFVYVISHRIERTEIFSQDDCVPETLIMQSFLCTYIT